MSSSIPPVPIADLKVTAGFDYVRAHCPVRFTEAYPHGGRFFWSSVIGGAEGYTLTIHDPTPQDIAQLSVQLDKPPLWGFELFVDFWPADHVAAEARAELLERTFTAMAARFRPDDELQFGAGMRAAFDSHWPIPFYAKLPTPNQTVVYSHRHEGHQAKLYLKRRDQGKDIPPDQYRVRLETTLDRFGCRSLAYGKHGAALDKVADLGTAGMRGYFAKLFRIIDGAAVRVPKRRTAAKLGHLTLRMNEAWNRVGVNAFEAGELPPDASKLARDALVKRLLLSNSLSLGEYRLRRDRDVNEAIGRALAKLDRQLTAVFSRI